MLYFCFCVYRLYCQFRNNSVICPGDQSGASKNDLLYSSSCINLIFLRGGYFLFPANSCEIISRSSKTSSCFLVFFFRAQKIKQNKRYVLDIFFLTKKKMMKHIFLGTFSLSTVFIVQKIWRWKYLPGTFSTATAGRAPSRERTCASSPSSRGSTTSARTCSSGRNRKPRWLTSSPTSPSLTRARWSTTTTRWGVFVCGAPRDSLLSYKRPYILWYLVWYYFKK